MLHRKQTYLSTQRTNHLAMRSYLARLSEVTSPKHNKHGLLTGVLARVPVKLLDIHGYPASGPHHLHPSHPTKRKAYETARGKRLAKLVLNFSERQTPPHRHTTNSCKDLRSVLHRHHPNQTLFLTRTGRNHLESLLWDQVLRGAQDVFDVFASTVSV